MIMVIFTIWVIFAIACGILTEITDHDFFGFLFLVSLPIMFYVPLFLK